MFKSFITRLLGAFGYSLLLIAGGTVGYVMIEGSSVRDALYMTIITISAVGYHEVLPLSPAGRNLTMILIFLGISGIAIYLGLLTSFIVELDLRNTLIQKKTMKRIAQLRDHVVVCGAGRTGRSLATELVDAGRDFVAIDVDPEHLQLLREEHPDALCVEGDATHDSTLEEAGLDRAFGLVSALSRDADNVFVCLSARSLNAGLTIVARAYEDESVDKLIRAGANHVVSPNLTGAIRISAALLRPSVLSFLDVTTSAGGVDLRLEEARVGAKSPLVGRKLKEGHIREKTGLMVIAVRNGHGADFVFNPVADTTLEEGDELIVLGEPQQIERLKEYAEGR